MIRIGLFGAGFIGSVHARNISRHSALELTAIFDPNADAARKLAHETGAVAAETESDDLNRKIDAVVIASSTDTHADVLQRATRAGDVDTSAALMRMPSGALTETWLLWYGLMFMAVVLFKPEGIAGAWQELFKARGAGRAGVPAGPLALFRR